MVGILAAMPIEYEAILAQCEQIQSFTHPIVHAKAQCQGKAVWVALSGVGKVAASMATTFLCEKGVTTLLSVGTAGGLRQDQEVLDWVISDSIVQSDYDTSVVDGPEGLGKRFEVDKGLLEKAQTLLAQLNMPYHVGTVSTADHFVTNPDELAFPAICCEMEAGAIAQVGQVYHVPVIVLRALSDIVVKEGNELTFQEMAEKASLSSAQLVKAWLS